MPEASITHGLHTIGSDPIIANVMRLTNALDRNSSADAVSSHVPNMLAAEIATESHALLSSRSRTPCTGAATAQ
jgi:hypothetical protein